MMQQFRSLVYMKRIENKDSDTCIPMFTAALLTITKWWKQPKRPSVDKWIFKNLVYAYNGIKP